MIDKSYEIAGAEGLHARPASLLVGTVNAFQSDITLEHDGKKVNLKSILGVMSLGVPSGAVIKIAADGKDEAEVMAKVDEIMKSEGLAN